MYDAIIIGGGPAGLQAALTLGRIHRRALLLDSGAYRNAPAAHLHNFIGHDGTRPAELRARARRELAAYDTVGLRDGVATRVRGTDGDFAVELDDGTEAHAAKVVLATGVRDVMPETPGIAEEWGSLVHHCPFCHGHELAGRRIGLPDSPHVAMMQSMIGGLSDDIRVLSGVSAVRRDGDALRVDTADGEVVVDGMFAALAFEQAAPFAGQLGLKLNDSGCVAVDVMGLTSLPGVYAAGDLAHHPDLPMPMASVLVAAAAGQVAGASIARELAMAAVTG